MNNQAAKHVEFDDYGSTTVHNNNLRFVGPISPESISVLIPEFEKLAGSGYPEIKMFIHSPGGDAMSGMAMVDYLLSYPIPITTIINGWCASAATLVSVVGAKRLITPSSFMLIHQMSGGMWGKQDDLEDGVILWNKMKERMIQLYVGHTKLNRKRIEKMLERETSFNAEEALQHGFVDGIV